MIINVCHNVSTEVISTVNGIVRTLTHTRVNRYKSERCFHKRPTLVQIKCHKSSDANGELNGRLFMLFSYFGLYKDSFFMDKLLKKKKNQKPTAIRRIITHSHYNNIVRRLVYSCDVYDVSIITIVTYETHYTSRLVRNHL